MVCYSLRCLTRQIDQQTAQRSYLTRFGRRLRRQVMLVLRWSLQENILLVRLRLLENMMERRPENFTSRFLTLSNVDLVFPRASLSKSLSHAPARLPSDRASSVTSD